MPADANPAGDIFGGWVMSQIDLAAGISAGQRANSRVVAVAVDAMSFIQPVRVGGVLCVYTDVEEIGRTSMTVHVEAWGPTQSHRRKRQGDRGTVQVRGPWRKRTADAHSAIRGRMIAAV